LREAKIPDSGRSIYLHGDVLATNGDIAGAEVVAGGNPSRFAVSVEFTGAAAGKMRAATEGHVGRPVAILLDGVVAMAPVLRAPIGAKAVITGDLTRAEAERIVNGIR
jgi:preprotein translocase subunit SecD